MKDKLEEELDLPCCTWGESGNRFLKIGKLNLSPKLAKKEYRI